MSRRPRRTPEQLVDQAIALLAEAGALEPLLTVAEAAALVGVTTEAIRVWCRDNGLGCFSRQFRCFVIPLSDLHTYAKNHGKTVASFEFPQVPDRVVSLIFLHRGRSMPRELRPPSPRPLSESEQYQLQQLLDRSGQSLAQAEARRARERDQERRLRARQDKLAAEEARLAKRLAQLHVDIDIVSAKLF